MTTATRSLPAASVGAGAFQDIASLLGRILFAFLFVPAGWAKIAGFTGTAGYIASKGLPLPEVGAVIAIAVELGLGLAVLVGLRTRIAALGLAIFTFAAATFFHNYWAMPEAQQMVQQLMFNKNVAIVGGLLAFMKQFGMLRPGPNIARYVAAIEARPARQRAYSLGAPSA